MRTPQHKAAPGGHTQTMLQNARQKPAGQKARRWPGGTRLATGLATALACTALLAGCNSDGTSSSPASIAGASADQSISQQEALALVQSQSETGEPSSIATLSLQSSETDEPFGL